MKRDFGVMYPKVLNVKMQNMIHQSKNGGVLMFVMINIEVPLTVIFNIVLIKIITKKYFGNMWNNLKGMVQNVFKQKKLSKFPQNDQKLVFLKIQNLI